MKTYFRYQHGSYSLEEMQNYISTDGGDDGGTEGICATVSVTDLINNTVFSTGYASAEVVIFHGEKIQNIYDGVRVYPTEIITRMSADEFYARRDEIAEQYESW